MSRGLGNHMPCDHQGFTSLESIRIQGLSLPLCVHFLPPAVLVIKYLFITGVMLQSFKTSRNLNEARASWTASTLDKDLLRYSTMYSPEDLYRK